MAHIFFIDPLEKLNIRKDTSLALALTYQELGHETYLLFENDFYISSHLENEVKLYKFEGTFEDNQSYLQGFQSTQSQLVDLNSGDTIHMRIDPPYDLRYQRYLWMLDHLKRNAGVRVTNDPTGIMQISEKIYPLEDKASLPTFIGKSWESAKRFEAKLADSYDELVLKPVDLYSGIGVEKVKRSEVAFKQAFEQKVAEFSGEIIVQPFAKAVLQGEYRSLFLKGEEIGTILKTPKKGSFLTNVAQGGTFEQATLPKNLYAKAKKMADDLSLYGIDFIAYDLLGEAITEVNVTCPGLLVEVSFATGKNLLKEYCLKM